jgi:esterase/lipase superfamily enzyme
MSHIKCRPGAHSGFFLILAVFLATLSSIYLAPACRAKSHPEAPKYVIIPIYYVTDREMKGETYGLHRRYPSQCKHFMYYGTTFVGVPNTKHKIEDAKLKALGWQFSDEHPHKIATQDRVDPADPVLAKKQFFGRLGKALDQTGKPELCMFVHGACDPFEDSSQDAAALAYSLERPMVLYSWPASNRWKGYFVDAANNEWSQGHFNQFLKDLIAFKADHPLQLISLSHSMGNRLVIRALPVVYGKGLVSDWELVSPDIDADTCRHYVMDYKELNAPLRLYVSNKDKLLPFSQMLNGGYYRLGEAAMPTAGGEHIKGKLIERIDFTAVDTGFTGHSLPCDLIANMIASNKPGPELSLVPETEVKGSRFAKFAGRSRESRGESMEAADYCSRVVKAK